MTDANRIVRSFWVGPFYRNPAGVLVESKWDGAPEIGPMSRMAINSFLRLGHEFHLYTYHPLSGVPKGAVIKDAAEILPFAANERFQTHAQFYNYFIYHLMTERAGWTTGMDVLCLQALNFEDEYVFASDDLGDHLYITDTVLKVPANSAIMRACAGAVDRMDTLHADWAGVGPHLLHQQVIAHGLLPYVRRGATFDAVPYTHITQVADPAFTAALEKRMARSYCIHLRQSIWDGGANSCVGVLPDGSKISSTVSYSPGSLWEILKRRYA